MTPSFTRASRRACGPSRGRATASGPAPGCPPSSAPPRVRPAPRARPPFQTPQRGHLGEGTTPRLSRLRTSSPLAPRARLSSLLPSRPAQGPLARPHGVPRVSRSSAQKLKMLISKTGAAQVPQNGGFGTCTCAVPRPLLCSEAFDPGPGACFPGASLACPPAPRSRGPCSSESPLLRPALWGLRSPQSAPRGGRSATSPCPSCTDGGISPCRPQP